MCVRKIVSEQKGGVAIMFAVGFVVFLSFTAMVADVGFILVTKNELHNVADAAALAGTRQLGKIYEGKAFDVQQRYVLTDTDKTLITNAVLDAAGKNKAGGKSITTILPEEIIIGQWNGQTRTLKKTNDHPDTVEVTARRDEFANGRISTFFARLVGINAASVTSTSKREGGMWTGVESPTAALTGVGKVSKGGLTIPVGISKQWFVDSAPFCDQPIRFSPTNSLEGCAAWHVFKEGSHGASTLRDVINGLTANTYPTPETIAGETEFNFTGGELANAFDDFKALYEAKRDPDTKEWTTLVTVYDSSDCKNASGDTPIVGFATATITDVCFPSTLPCDLTRYPTTWTPPKNGDKVIVAKVECELIKPDTRGGGAEYGTKGSIPGLVE